MCRLCFLCKSLTRHVCPSASTTKSPSTLTSRVVLSLISLRFARNRDDLEAIGITHIVNCTPLPQEGALRGEGGVPNYFEGELQYFRCDDELQLPIVICHALLRCITPAICARPALCFVFVFVFVFVLVAALRCDITDTERVDISQYFEPAHVFMRNALAHGGKVLVHCQMGISRSATILLSYVCATKTDGVLCPPMSVSTLFCVGIR